MTTTLWRLAYRTVIVGKRMNKVPCRMLDTPACSWSGSARQPPCRMHQPSSPTLRGLWLHARAGTEAAHMSTALPAASAPAAAQRLGATEDNFWPALSTEIADSTDTGDWKASRRLQP